MVKRCSSKYEIHMLNALETMVYHLAKTFDLCSHNSSKSYLGVYFQYQVVYSLSNSV